MNKEMEKKLIKIGIAFFTMAFLFMNSTYIIDQREQVIVLQFGKIVKFEKKAGLKLKIPFVQNVVRFDKRIMDIATEDREVISADQKRIIINTFTKYKISDPLAFYTRTGSVNGSFERVNSIIDSSMRQIIGQIQMSELLTENRSAIMKKITDIVREKTEIFGIEIVDVRIMRADLPKENSDAIYRRMQTEKEIEAKKTRAEGEEEARKIRANADRQKIAIIANARREAEIQRGIGDAEATRLFASFKNDKDFYEFYRSMQAYKTAIKPDNTTLIMDTSNDFLKYFQQNK